MATRKPKPISEPDEHEDQTELLQVKVTHTAKKLLIEHAQKAYLTPTAYHRHLIYQALGIINPTKE
jgi:hypothetical protein